MKFCQKILIEGWLLNPLLHFPQHLTIYLSIHWTSLFYFTSYQSIVPSIHPSILVILAIIPSIDWMCLKFFTTLHPSIRHPSIWHPSIHPTSLHPSDILSSIHPTDIIHPTAIHPTSLHPSDILSSIYPTDIIHLTSLHPSDILSSIHPSDILSSIHPSDILSSIHLSDILSSIHSADIHPSDILSSIHPTFFHPSKIYIFDIHIHTVCVCIYDYIQQLNALPLFFMNN